MLELSRYGTVCQETKVTRGSWELFLKAISVWINKPHVVNRRLCGSTIHHVRRCQTKNEAEEAVAESKKLFGESSDEALALWEAGESFKELSEEKHPYTVIFRESVPKSEFFPRLLDTIVYERDKARVIFFPSNESSEAKEAGKVLPTKEVLYSICFKETDCEMPVWAQVNEITLDLIDHTESEMPRCQMTSQWLRSVLLDKLVKWSQVNDISTSATSLMLVAVDKYKEMYVRLKNTYGRDLVNNWPERTDPKKFVYEDVAIAAYLLLIWEEDRERKGLKEKQSFVDLGCGNGLLVYILTKEGHKGLGIDLRKRKIWDMFGPGINLREEAIKPSSEHLFPEYDWLIGNHSDELTPWIPVIAARSSPSCCFFVLPCCHHDFVGKFSAQKKGQSRYGTYVDYIKEIVEHCGFSPEVDTLRIPSTKRICLMGRQRTYKPGEEVKADVRRQAFIDKRALLSQHKDARVLRTNSSESGVSSNPLENLVNIRLHRKGSSSTEETSSQLGSLDPDRLKLMELDFLKDNSGQLGSLDSGYSSLPSLPDDLEDSPLPDDNTHRNFGISLKRSESQETSKLHVAKKMRTSSETEPDTDMRSVQGHFIMDEAGRQDEAVKKWAPGFQPRSESGVRNCQTVPEEIKLKIVNSVFDLVLNSEGDKNVAELSEGKQWRKGGSASLSEVAGLFDQLTLQELKAECGGLQTLLRNHSHIFQVSGGRVRLRDFTQTDPWKGSNPHKRLANKARAEQRDTRKTTLCWFHEHHPDGCPRSSSVCSFAHGQTELREKPAVGQKQGSVLRGSIDLRI